MSTTRSPSTIRSCRGINVLSLICLTLSLMACSTPMVEPSSGGSGSSGTSNSAGKSDTDDNPATRPPIPSCCGNPDAQRMAEELARQKAAISQRTIYFAYDQYRVAATYMPTIEAHARYMLRNPKALLRLAGHADERGSREYNLALGQKRAENVQQALMLYGVAAQRIEAISYGSEKPVATGSNEAAWQRNRRAELSYESE